MYCSVCEDTLLVGEDKRYCYRCYSVERHRVIAKLYRRNLLGDLNNKKVLIISEGKTKTEYVETAYFFNKISKVTTLDICEHDTLNNERVYFDIYKNIEDLASIEDNTFDGIVINHVLSAIENDLTGLSELTRILKPEGSFILTDGIRSKTQAYIAPFGVYCRREWTVEDLTKILRNYFEDVELIFELDDIMNINLETFICKKNKKNKLLGSSTPYPNDGWWRNIIVAFGLPYTGLNTIRQILNYAGYDTVHIDKQQCIQENKLDSYDKIQSNIIKDNPIFQDVLGNAFIMDTIYINKIEKLLRDYPACKIIYTDRDTDSLIKAVGLKNNSVVIKNDEADGEEDEADGEKNEEEANKIDFLTTIETSTQSNPIYLPPKKIKINLFDNTKNNYERFKMLLNNKSFDKNKFQEILLNLKKE